ncbi:MAG: hypothetical protein WBK26_09760 [Burkholderiaceae bacterium]
MTKIEFKLSALIFMACISSNAVYAFSDSTWLKNDSYNVREFLLSNKTSDNSDGVRIVRRNPALYFSILDKYINDIKNNQIDCKNFSPSYKSEIRKIFGYSRELFHEHFDSILSELISINGHLEGMDNDSCTEAIEVIQEIILSTSNQKGKSSIEIERIKKYREKKIELEITRKNIEKETSIASKRLEDNKNSPAIAMKISDFELCDAFGRVIDGNLKLSSLEIFGSADNIKSVIEREMKKRNLKANPTHIRNGATPLGSSYCQVYASIGFPQAINTNEGPWGLHQQFIYRKFARTKYIYFKNGIVNSIQY